MNFGEYNGFFEGQTVLVTGGAGFIGSHLTRHLEQLGCGVRLLDDFSSGHRHNLQGCHAVCFEGSILDLDVLSKAMEGCTIVFHEAAMVSVPLSIKDPKECHEINNVGTSLVIQEAIAAGCSRIVFASSAACYGSKPTLPSAETDEPSLESPYAQSKFDCEQLLQAHAKEIDAVSLRYFNIFGERQDPRSQYAAVVSAFADAIEQGCLPTIFGDGTQTRDFTHVGNVVHANLLAASHHEPLSGDVFNVGTGIATSLLDLLRMMTKMEHPEVDFQPTRLGDVQHSCADITAIQHKLGYTPVMRTADGIRKLINPTRR